MKYGNENNFDTNVILLYLLFIMGINMFKSELKETSHLKYCIYLSNSTLFQFSLIYNKNKITEENTLVQHFNHQIYFHNTSRSGSSFKRHKSFVKF